MARPPQSDSTRYSWRWSGESETDRAVLLLGLEKIVQSMLGMIFITEYNIAHLLFPIEGQALLDHYYQLYAI